MALSPGQRIGNYAVIASLGEGGMASVWSARHVHLESQHALKMLDPSLLSSRDLRARFLNEGRIQAQIRHPNLVAVTDIVIGDGLAVLVMDYAPGESLRARLDRGWRATPDEALAIVLPVLDGLAHAHDHGVVHRDIKPSNIVVGEAPRGGPMPRLIDFGVAKVDEASGVSTSSAKGATRTGARIGTTEYMSPEQVRGLADLDARSDLYSVGITLFELLTGQTPFAGQDDFELMKAIVETAPPDVRDLVPGVPASLAQAIAVALSKDRDRRPASADALVALLRPSGPLPPTAAPTAPAPAVPPAAPRSTAGGGSDGPAKTMSPWRRAVALARLGQAPMWFALTCAAVAGLVTGLAYEALYYDLDDPLDHWVTLGLIWPLAVTAPLWTMARPRWRRAALIACGIGLLELGDEEGLGAMGSLVVVALTLPDQVHKGWRVAQGALTLGLAVVAFAFVEVLSDGIDDEWIAYIVLFTMVWGPGLALLSLERWLRAQTRA